ncbi:MAG: hypothetical protein LBJ21_07745 [Acidobacteriota bacterium]|jgi:hypothetical protein|nr:hypothetical protein [Acidobacteriota bacterium]
MNRYSKMFLSLLLASATTLFVCGIAAEQAVAAFQDEAEEVEMTEEEYAAYEAEYAAWEAADKETDILKSGAMLMEFLQKNKESKLAPYAENSYKVLLSRCYEEKKYQELETLAEQWNAFKPGDESIVRMIAVAAQNLKHTDKYLGALEEMYKKTPEVGFAREIAALYKEMKNEAKYVEWTETILKGSDGASDVLRHYDLFRQYLAKGDSAKTMEYAQSTLKAVDQQKNPPADLAKLLPDIRHEINHYIGATYFTDKRYDDSITYLMRALRDKKYANGYLLIGRSLWEQKKILNARMAFAKAQLFGESPQADKDDKSIAPKAKELMEQIHRSLQNNTLVGIERQYKRAQEMTDEDLLKPLQ